MEIEEVKKESTAIEVESESLVRTTDIELDLMIDEYRIKQHLLQPHLANPELKLHVCARKRPILPKEELKGEVDAISCANPKIILHESRIKIDGKTKYIENHDFTFDNTFNQNESNEDVYQFTVQPLIDLILNQGIVTCFAYGATGSGKTYTMNGIRDMAIRDILELNATQYKHLNLKICASFYEFSCGNCYDLLNEYNKLRAREDQYQNV